MIQSGSVFVFDERESGIKRWTDGRVWSPSRILGNFLIYRELDKRAPGEKRHSSSTATSAAAAGDMRQRSYSADHGGANGGVSTGVDRGRERQLVGSLSDSYKFRKDGLIKKTMSIVVNGVAQHLISYYHPMMSYKAVCVHLLLFLNWPVLKSPQNCFLSRTLESHPWLNPLWNNNNNIITIIISLEEILLVWVL